MGRRSCARLLPERRASAIGHGQMPAEELEKVMVDFVDGKLDVLVCTTIIESGLDIPRANTMFVNRADAFGLAQLYQLRGRIGRSQERAFCYLLVPPEEHRSTRDAKQRLAVLQRFTELGAGFQIASHDLEIRGAGELLGAKQSGAIAAVGFETYTRDARGGGRRAAGRADPPASSIPSSPSTCPASSPTTTSPTPASGSSSTGGCRRRATRTTCARSLAELADRYGPLPDEVDAPRRDHDRQGARPAPRRARHRADRGAPRARARRRHAARARRR